jgi:hypothetical protein
VSEKAGPPQVHLFALTPSADTAEQQQRDKMKQAGVTETGVSVHFPTKKQEKRETGLSVDFPTN